MNRELRKLLEDANRWDPNYIYELPTTYKRKKKSNILTTDKNNISILEKNETAKNNGSLNNTVNNTTNSISGTDENLRVNANLTKYIKRTDKMKLVTEKVAHKQPVKKLGENNSNDDNSSSTNGKKEMHNHTDSKRNVKKRKKIVLSELTDVNESTDDERIPSKNNITITTNDDTTIADNDDTTINNSSLDSIKANGTKRNNNNKLNSNKKTNHNLPKKKTKNIDGAESKYSNTSREPSLELSRNDDTESIHSDLSDNSNYFASIETFFIEQESKVINLNPNFFNTNFNKFDLNSIKIIPSETLSNMDHSAPTDSSKWVNLHNLLLDNVLESYEVNFQKDRIKYDPMLEVGKLIEYFILIYLPDNDHWQDKLTKEILIPLNKAYDNNDQLNFVQIVQNYNKLIINIPKSLIKLHLKEKLTLPQSFIHDFLQIIYCRSIHPHANKLKNYQAFSNFVYGELLPNFLSEVFYKCNLNKDSIFIDLGSGVGNCVIQASLEFGCKLSVGCEIMDNASDLTELQLVELNNRCKLMGINVSPIEFILRESFVGNARVIELLKKCDVLLINNFLFDSKLNAQVEKLLQNCKVGCKIITLKNLRRWGYTIDFFNVDNILSRMKIEKYKFKQDSVSWTHNGGEYFISTILDSIDESLLEQESRFRKSDRNVRYSK